MTKVARLAAAFSIAAFSIPSAISIQQSALPVELLRAVSAMPAHVAGQFRDIAACHQTPDGDFLVFDRRAHAVYSVAPNLPPRQIVQIGVEPGRILLPLSFDSAPDGRFVIADAPTGTERIQIFFYAGGTVGGFTLPGRSVPSVAMGDVVLSGIGSLEYTGNTILVSQPSSGALITEYGVDGSVVRSFGELRQTGHEEDALLHAALNAGMAVALPNKGGYYFVFLGGVPVFRKYDAAGRFLFERHVEGPELDEHIQGLPSSWPRRKTSVGEFPVVPPTVRTAAVDANGNLWLSLMTPYTYVYDVVGNKARTIQFQGAGLLAPTHMYFTRDKRLLVSPGCYTFDPKGQSRQG